MNASAFLLKVYIEVQKDILLCFIAILDKLDINGKTLQWIRNLYWEQTAAVRVYNQLSDWIEIKRGFWQGCVLSPDLFSLLVN